jgi:hypothetical protein
MDRDLLPSTECEDCPAGTFTRRPKQFGRCSDCPIGRTSEGGSGACDRCPEGWFGYREGGNCTLCSELVTEHKLANLQGKERNDLLTAFAKPEKSCRGGALGLDAVVIPQSGIYIHFNDETNNAELIKCQNQESCEGVAGNESAWLEVVRNSSGRRRAAQIDHRYLGASCRDGHNGFLCGECQEGTVKIKGVCAECPGFNWGTLATSLAINLAMALFLVCRRPPTPLTLPRRFLANYILNPPTPPPALY